LIPPPSGSEFIPVAPRSAGTIARPAWVPRSPGGRWVEE
jgi:hypothetical protein